MNGDSYKKILSFLFCEIFAFFFSFLIVCDWIDYLGRKDFFFLSKNIGDYSAMKM